MTNRSLTIAAGLALCGLAACDERPTEPALVVVEQGQVAFGGDETACLQRAYGRNEDADEDGESHVWTVEAAEGSCMHFPLVLGVQPDGAADMSGSARLTPNDHFHFETGTADRRFVADFRQASGNDIFYVRDRDGNWTDIRRAQQ